MYSDELPNISGKVVSLCEAGAMAVVACSWEDAKDIAVKYEVEVSTILLRLIRGLMDSMT